MRADKADDAGDDCPTDMTIGVVERELMAPDQEFT